MATMILAKVAVSGERGYAQRISTGGHELAADEPVKRGGTDTGPSPFELMLSSLGACTAITLRM
jgi:putative redox protein